MWSILDWPFIRTFEVFSNKDYLMTTEPQAPRSAEDWFQKGLTLGRAGDNEGAISSYENAVAIDPDHFRAWFNLGSRYGKLLKNAKALPCYQKAVELKPDDVMAHYSLAVICNLLNMIEDSIEHYETAIKLNPNFARAHSNLATVHYSVKRGREAIHHLRIAKKLFEEQGELHMVETAESLLQESYHEFKLSPKDFD